MMRPRRRADGGRSDERVTQSDRNPRLKPRTLAVSSSLPRSRQHSLSRQNSLGRDVATRRIRSFTGTISPINPPRTPERRGTIVTGSSTKGTGIDRFSEINEFAAGKRYIASGQQTLRFARTLRKFIAQDAINFAAKERDIYQALLNRPRVTTQQAVTKAFRDEESRADTALSLSHDSSAVDSGNMDSGQPVSLKASVTSDHGSDETSQSSAGSPVIFAGCRQVFVTLACCVLTLRSFSRIHRLSMLWGGGVVVVPWMSAFGLIAFPLLVLEVGIGNNYRGGVSQCLGSVSPVFRSVGIISWFGLAWRISQQAVSASRLAITCLQLFSVHPEWLSPTNVRLECEQTRPNPATCILKEGCLYIDSVCTVDPMYWATVYNASINDSGFTRVVTVAVFMWVACALSQGLHVHPINNLMGTTTILGIFILIYFAYHEINQIYGQSGVSSQFAALALGARGSNLNAWEMIISPGLWMAAFHHAIELLDLGRGIAHTCGSLAPIGLNFVRLAFWICVGGALGGVALMFIGDSLIRNMSYRTGKSPEELIEALPHFFNVLLPATAGNVPHKRYVVTIILLCVLLSEFASMSFGGAVLTENLMSSQWIGRRTHKRVVTALITTVVCTGLISVHYIGQQVDYLNALNLLGPLLVLLIEVLSFGWLLNHRIQARYVGITATLGLMFCYVILFVFGLALGLPCLLTLLNTSLDVPITDGLYTMLPIVVICLAGLISLVLIPLLLTQSAKTTAEAKYSRKIDRRSDDNVILKIRSKMSWGRSLLRSVAPGGNDDSPKSKASGPSSRRHFELPRSYFSSPKAPESDGSELTSVSLSLQHSNRKALPIRPVPRRHVVIEAPKTLNVRSSSESESSQGGGDTSTTSDTLLKHHEHAVWWLWMGNVEVLRHDFNCFVAENEMGWRARFTLTPHWSVCIKFVAPLLLVLLIFHTACDFCASMSGNLDYVWNFDIREGRLITLLNVPLHARFWYAWLGYMATVVAAALGLLVMNRRNRKVTTVTPYLELPILPRIPQRSPNAMRNTLKEEVFRDIRRRHSGNSSDSDLTDASPSPSELFYLKEPLPAWAKRSVANPLPPQRTFTEIEKTADALISHRDLHLSTNMSSAQPI